ncbi:hypothetical protein TL16_g03335 [Triparma laevis f. inornata]|uniref:Protein kinase domain-containing protein n=1 Tax=Triparma laevis f. inornata TaxID=1714386 RepID=A0A9W7A5L4_9STRA|nr:hypothetical protein TL16_g03335 [Triparma laevis f. inornata]
MGSGQSGLTKSSRISPHFRRSTKDPLNETRHTHNSDNSEDGQHSSKMPPSPPLKTHRNFPITQPYSTTLLFPSRGSLDPHSDPTLLELVSILKDPFGFRLFRKQAFVAGHQRNILCFHDVEIYRTIPNKHLRATTARRLYEKYLKAGASQHLPNLYYSEEANKAMENIEEILSLETMAERQKRCRPNIFDEIGNLCLLNLLPVFKSFKENGYTFYKSRVRSHNKLRPTSFDYLSILGTYNNSKVFMVRKKTTNRVYSMKIYSKRNLMKRYQLKEQNIHIERLVSHHCGMFPFVVSLGYAIQTQSHVCLAFDYCAGGDLRGLLKFYSRKKQRIPDALLLKIAAQLIYAVGHLHLVGILHRDLKLSNIMLSKHGNVKVGDFGSAGVVRPLELEEERERSSSFDYRFDPFSDSSPRRGFWNRRQESPQVVFEGESPADPNASSILVMDYATLPEAEYRKRKRRTFIGTLGNMSPEVVKCGLGADESGYSFECDWFSVGVVMYQLATNASPFRSSAKSKSDPSFEGGERDWCKKSTMNFVGDALGGIRVHNRQEITLQGDFDTGADDDDDMNMNVAEMLDRSIGAANANSFNTMKGEKETTGRDSDSFYIEEDQKRKLQEYWVVLEESKIKFDFDFMDEDLKDLIEQMLKLDPTERLGSRVSEDGFGAQDVISHDFFRDVDFDDILSPNGGESWNLDDSLRRGGGATGDPSPQTTPQHKKKEEKILPEFENFQDALISWSVMANLSKAQHTSDPLSISRHYDEKKPLKKEVDLEHFEQWDYMSAETIQLEMQATKRHSNLVQVDRSSSLNVTPKAFGSSSVRDGLTITTPTPHYPTPHVQNRSVGRGGGGGGGARDDLDVTRRRGEATSFEARMEQAFEMSTNSPSFLDVSNHSVLDMRSDRHANTVITVDEGYIMTNKNRIRSRPSMDRSSHGLDMSRSRGRTRRGEVFGGEGGGGGSDDSFSLELLGTMAMQEVLKETKGGGGGEGKREEKKKKEEEGEKGEGGREAHF